MEVRRLFENIEIDWERLRGPELDRGEQGLDLTPMRDGPSLRSVRTEHLRSVPDLLSLHEDAVARGFIKESEAGLIAFLTTAARCLRRGRNPAALFRYLAERGCLNSTTLEDEDYAYARLKMHRKAERSRASFLKWKSTPPPELE